MSSYIFGFAVAKGVTIGTVVVAIVHSSLSPFTQALLIALVSASIGALGMIVAAIITRDATRTVERQIDERARQLTLKADEATAHLTDVRRKLGVEQRERDTPDERD